MAQKFIIQKRSLGERIKRLAGEKNISLSRIETQAGYSLGMLTRWANAPEDENFEIFSKLVTIASILGVSIDELLGVSGTRPKGNRSESLLLSMITSTKKAVLQWVEADRKTAEELSRQEPDEHAPAGAWSVERGQLRFLLAAYCDDLDDEEEPMNLRLYALAGHGIPPQLIQGETALLQTLYIAIQLQAAHQSLAHDTVD